MIRKSTLAVAMAAVLAAAPHAGFGQEARPPYFSQIDLTPIGNASRSTATQEPAVVLVFSGEAGSADATALFNTWANSSTRSFRGPTFGVAYRAAGQPQEILEEVLTQRNLKFPVFSTETDLLNGRQYRLMVIAGGLSYDVPGLDFAALDREIARHTGGGEGAKPPVATPVAAALSPTPAPTPAPTSPPGSETPAPTPDAAASPTPAGTPDAEQRSGRYYNTRYGFTVDFPRGWTYRVARNEDGAVGRAPAGTANIDLRAWAVPNAQAPGGGPGSMDLRQYVEEHLQLLSEQTGTRVGILQRFQVNDEGRMGLDYLYSFSRPVDQTAPRAPLVVHRGRIQVFETDGVFKVVSAEAPMSLFEGSKSVIEDFIQSFHPFIADDEGNPISEPPAGAAAGGGTPQAPVTL